MAFVKRKIRFEPEKSVLCLVSFNTAEFIRDAAALVINESVHGACLVINKKLIPQKVEIGVGLPLLVKIGELEPELAVVRWSDLIDEDLIKIGIEREG